jgi:imidazolonepropionase
VQVDLIISNVRMATMDPDVGRPYGAVSDAQVGMRDGRIVRAGPRRESGLTAENHFDAQGGWLTPGLIDCHTHLVYGGSRATEWESRLQGASYEEIARGGGGIVSTVKATRNASFEELEASARKRLQRLMAEGVTCIEIKSGYGLEPVTERKMLEVAASLSANNAVRVCKTFLGAHALPPEFKGEGDAYIQLIVEQMLPDLAAANLVDAVDVFCENIGFSRDQCERVFQCAQQLGLPVKGHVEQLSNLSGARLVAEYGGLSVDHLEYLADDDIPFIQQHNVVPVLLPGAFYFLNETQKPPVQGFRDAGVGMAIATDLNPGSSPICSLLLIMNMACVQFALTAEEALAGVTRHAARALGLGQSKGMIRAGMDADLVLWNIDDPSELSYAVNMSIPAYVWVAGQHV